MPKRRDTADEHPFRKTTSGFESLIPRGGSEDFFFSKLFVDPEHAAEFFEHGGDDREPLLGDPRVGIAVSGVVHVVLVLFLLFDSSLFNFLDSAVEPEEQIVETEKKEPLVLFMDEPQPPAVAAVPVVPVVPVPEAQPAPAPAEPQPRDNAIVIPKAMLAPDDPLDARDDLPFSRGNTAEFYTSEEVKKPGEEGASAEKTEPDAETLVAEESGEDDADVDEAAGKEGANDAVDVADDRLSPRDLGDLLFRNSIQDATDEARKRDEQRRRIQPPEPRVTRRDVGQGGENGEFTDIRRFLAGSQFDHPTGGLVVAGRDNTLYYNDRGANFVPWIAHMLAEVRRTWIASMPYAANVYAGHTAVRFKVARNGTVIAIETIVRSGVPGFDNNAEGAIRGARLSPLPADYPDDTFEIIIVFWVNERPYNIFG